MMQSSQDNRLYSSRASDEARLVGENSKKNVLKTYNTKFHNFGYEHQQKQKNTFIEVYAEKSTPSDISRQSVLENNDDIFHVIPTLKELLILAECQNFEAIKIDEYYSLLSILKIRQACGITGPPKYFKLQNDTDQITMEDFVAFFTSDVQNLDLTKFSGEELVLKLGLEIFRAMSKENIFLELRHLVDYIKEHKKLDVDLTSMLEIFDFFMDPDQGVLKTKTSLISFFHKNASRLARALDAKFLNQLRHFTENKKNDEAVTIRREENSVEVENNKGSNIIKIYDSNAKCNIKNRQSTINIAPATNKETNTRDLERVIQTSQINLDKNMLDIDQQFFNLGISEVFEEILPKNRGWLMRKSNRYENKWSQVFFEVKDNKLISTKPTALKRSIDVKSLKIHKCNLLEVMKRLDNSQHQESHKRNKRANSHSRVPTKKDSRIVNHPKGEQEKPDYLFFIVDKATQKTYLIKSPDNLIIGSIIRFYMMKDSQNNNGVAQFSITEPEYSGVIEIAVCKKKCIHKYHSSLKAYSFKKQFLVIKHGRFNIYEMKTKDNFDLLDYETKIHPDYDLLPQTHKYIFSLEKIQNFPPHELVSKRPVANNNLMAIQEVEPFAMERVKTNPYLASPKFNNEHSFGAPQIHYEDLKVIEYKNTTSSKGFFSNIIRKIQSTIKKDTKIILACDTELKRRQWVLTLKFFSQLAQSALFRSSFTKDSGLSAQDDSHKGSFQTEYNPSLPDNAGSRTKHQKKQSSISIKHKPTYNPDFVDVYKAEEKGNSHEQQEQEEQEQEQEQISPRDIEVRSDNMKRDLPLVTEPDVKPNTAKKNLPLITEPDASQYSDSEEILMTFQVGESLPFMMTKSNTLNNRIIENFENEKLLFSNEIKSMSDVEIWQRFLLFFIQEKHSCAEFDLNNVSVVESTEFVLGQDTEELEEDASARTVVLSDFSVNKRS